MNSLIRKKACFHGGQGCSDAAPEARFLWNENALEGAVRSIQSDTRLCSERCGRTISARHVFAAFLFFAFCIFPSMGWAKTAADVLGEIPVQHSGRVKPFESFAREVSLAVTGGERFSASGGQNLSATSLVWHWMAGPETWFAAPMIPVPNKILAAEFPPLAIIKGRVSPQIILAHKPFLEKAEAASQRQAKKEKLTLLDQKRLEIYSHAVLFQEIAKGALPGWIAHPEDPRAGWLPFQGFVSEAVPAGDSEEGQARLFQFYPQAQVMAAQNSLRKTLDAFKENPDSGKSLEAAEAFKQSLEALLESRGVALDPEVLRAERIYNRLRVFEWAWKFYLAAAFLFVFLTMPFVLKISESLRLALNSAAFLSFSSGFLVHFYGFYLRCVIAGRPPVSNMYESVIWVSWAVAFFSLVLFAFFRSSVILMISGLVASFALMIAQSFPALLDPAITPLVPVLRSNWWLTIHVLTITLSYGAFALGWGLGHGVLFRFAFGREEDEGAQRLAQYLYRAIQIGVILLASGTVLGGVWANYSWGRFWGWDPKETWALIALLGYLAVLHGRFAGWLDVFGLAMGSVIAFLGIVMAWYGVNYVLAAGLHSYGFGGGGAPYVGAIALLDMALVGFTAWVYKRKKIPQSAVD